MLLLLKLCAVTSNIECVVFLGRTVIDWKLSCLIQRLTRGRTLTTDHWLLNTTDHWSLPLNTDHWLYRAMSFTNQQWDTQYVARDSRRHHVVRLLRCSSITALHVSSVVGTNTISEDRGPFIPGPAWRRFRNGVWPRSVTAGQWEGYTGEINVCGNWSGTQLQSACRRQVRPNSMDSWELEVEFTCTASGALLTE